MAGDEDDDDDDDDDVDDGDDDDPDDPGGVFGWHQKWRRQKTVAVEEDSV